MTAQPAYTQGVSPSPVLDGGGDDDGDDDNIDNDDGDAKSKTCLIVLIVLNQFPLLCSPIKLQTS